MISNEARFNALIAEARSQEFKGWDFSYLRGRWHEEAMPWDYESLVRQYMQNSDSLLDMGTGGGEFLSSLAPLPEETHATEAYYPNVNVARRRLEPLNVTVHAIEEEAVLPFDDTFFDLVINRHEWYDPAEVWRILKAGGTFLTQQVGDQNDLRLNELISGEPPDYDSWHLKTAYDALSDAGFAIIQQQEVFPPLSFFDIGAIVYYLKVVEWQIPNFDVDKYRQQLGAIHNMIEADGKITIPQHRFLLIAKKPEL